MLASRFTIRRIHHDALLLLYILEYLPKTLHHLIFQLFIDAAEEATRHKTHSDVHGSIFGPCPSLDSGLVHTGNLCHGLCILTEMCKSSVAAA